MVLDRDKTAKRTKNKDEREKKEKETEKEEKGEVEEKEGKKGYSMGGCDRLHNCTVHSTNVSILSINPRYKSNLRFGRRGGKIPWGVDGPIEPRI